MTSPQGRRHRSGVGVGYAAHLRRRGLPWAQIVVQTVLHTAIRLGREGTVDPTLEALLGRRPTSVAEHLRREQAVWAPSA